MIRFEGVQRTFPGVTALAGLDLEIENGELIALLGPSGCGKTTALKILGGFDRPDLGRVLVDDRDITNVPPNKRDMGMVFQAYSLFPNMDVRTNVAFGLRMRRQDKATRFKRADDLLALVGLSETANRYPYQLSGGQQQRVAIARALAIEPTVLLLDEPLSALDALVRAQLRTEIRALQQRLGITTLFVTHDQSEALSIADRVGVMHSGRLEQLDTPENVYRRPATQFGAEFVGAMNRLPGRIGDNHEVQVLGQRLTLLNPNGQQPGEVVDALLRPEALQIAPDSAGSGTVTDRTFLGSAVRLEVTLEDTGQKERAPARALIVGAGYIGLEMAEALSARGLSVTQMERLPEVLPTVDPELGALVHAELTHHGVDVLTSTSVTGIRRTEDGDRLHVEATSPGGSALIRTVDVVLVVVGVRPASGLAADAGAILGPAGAIGVDRRMRTNVADVFAAGDCVITHHRLLGESYLPLGTTAHKQGRIAGENAIGGTREFAGSLGTQAVKIFDEAAARIGLRDGEAAAAGFDPLTVQSEADDHKAYYPGSHRIRMLVTGDRATGQLLGVQLFGHRDAEIAKRIDIAATAIFHDMSVDAISDLDLSYTPPFGSPWDAIQTAAQSWSTIARASRDARIAAKDDEER